MIVLALYLLAVEPVPPPAARPPDAVPTTLASIAAPAPPAAVAPAAVAPAAIAATPAPAVQESAPARAPAVEAPPVARAPAHPAARPGKRFKQHRLVFVPPAGSGTPLALVFHGDHVALDHLAFDHLTLDHAAGAAFPFEPGAPVRSAWPRAATPWLVRDLDGDGRVTSGRELFGSFTLVDGAPAAHGFAALAALDDNHDGVIDAADAAFPSLALWRDRDQDRQTGSGELEPLGAAGVVSLDVDFAVVPFCDRHGDCERERAGFRYEDALGLHTGAVIDVHLALERGPGPGT